MSPYRLRVTLSYEPHLAGGDSSAPGSENETMLRLFVSHALGSPSVLQPEHGIVILNHEQVVASQTKPATISVPFAPQLHRARLGLNSKHAIYPRSVDVGPEEQPPFVMPRDAALLIDGYVHTASQLHQRCETRAGEAVFLLHDLLANEGPLEAEHSVVEGNVQNTGSEPLVKGLVTVHKTVLERATGGGWSAVAASRVLAWEAQGANPQIFPEMHESSLIDAASQLSISDGLRVRAFNGLSIFGYSDPSPVKGMPGVASGAVDPPLLENVDPKATYMKKIHCPFYLTRAGMLPGSTYIRHVSHGPPPTAFYVQMLNMALFRANVDPSSAVRALEIQSKSQTLLPSTTFVHGLYGEFLNQLTTSMIYLSDEVNSGGATLRMNKASRLVELHKGGVEGTEDYKDGTLADDCEGLAHHIAKVALLFGDLKLAFGHDVDQSVRTLLAMFQKIAQQNVYTVHLVLAAVTAAQMKPGEIPSAKDIGAHTFTALVPTARLRTRIAGPHAKEVLESRYFRTARKHEARWHGDLPVLILEGTARAPSLALPPLEYYPPSERSKMRKALASRLQVEQQLMRELSHIDASYPRLVQFPMPPFVLTAAEAKGGGYSAFYKTMQSTYCDIAVETGILDYGLGRRQKDGSLTSSIPFEAFISPEWPSDLVWIPFNKAEPAYQDWVNAVHDLVEPSPAPEFVPVVPPRLRASHGIPSAPLKVRAGEFPSPGSTFTVSIRHEDATEELLSALDTALGKLPNVTSIERREWYVCEPPIHGESAEVKPNIVHDVKITVG